MTLATRCPACGTVFRVVQDQLKVSEGWVRCGRCSEVFNAVDQMVELGMSASSPRVAPGLAPPTPGLHEPSHHILDADIEIEAAPHIDIDEPVVTVEPVVHAGFAEPANHVAFAGWAEPPAPAPVGAARDVAAVVAHGEPFADDAEQQTLPTGQAGVLLAPSFVQTAERAQRWQSPAVRRGLTAATLLAVMVLTIQVMVEYRDLIVARWSNTRPALEAMCRWAGCRIDPPRMIDALVVDSSGLTRVDGTNTYRFALVLRNRAAMELAMPAVDLVLSDSQGRVISRRVLRANELGAPAQTVAPNAEFLLQAILAVAEHPVAGYTIEVFYP